MPELPEVEAVCRKLRQSAPGLRITSAKVFRCAPALLEESVRGRSILAVDRLGKHILLRLSDGVTLHTHLRMSGNLFAIPDYRFHSAGARVVLRLTNGEGIVLEDPRALARMEPVETETIDRKLAAGLGPEPLSPEFTPEWFRDEARQSRQPAKLFLMDQARVAGLGNIYAAESLFRARVDPRKAVNRLSRAKLEALHGEIVAVLRDAVQSAVSAYGSPGKFAEAESFPIAVYGREGEPCERCGSVIRRIAQGGRSTYFCPGCQR